MLCQSITLIKVQAEGSFKATKASFLHNDLHCSADLVHPVAITDDSSTPAIPATAKEAQRPALVPVLERPQAMLQRSPSKRRRKQQYYMALNNGAS